MDMSKIPADFFKQPDANRHLVALKPALDQLETKAVDVMGPYKLVQEATITDFETTLMNLYKDGWKLYGSPIILNDSVTPGALIYIQAMVRQEGYARFV